MSNDKKKLTIAITGGIGSGKSTVGKMISKRGYTVLDSDIIARDVTRPGTGGLARVVELFGEEILKPDGSMDREIVSGIIFNDASKREMLENILHPMILDEINRKVDELREDFVFVLVPLLFETNLQDRFDKIWLCFAPSHVRLERAMVRDSVTAKKVQSRMSAQILDEKKIPKSDTIINTAITLSETETEIESALKELVGKMVN